MVTGGDADDEALLLWSLVVEEESITESILIVHPLFVNKKKIHFPHYKVCYRLTFTRSKIMVTSRTFLNPC